MRASLLLLTACVLAGCNRDPIDKPGTWSLAPTGLDSNAENLRVMLVNPQDLTAGAGEDTSSGALAAKPVQLLVNGQRHALPSANTTTFDASQNQQPSTTGGNGGSPQQ